MPRLLISLLGPLQVQVDGPPTVGFEYNKVRGLLAYLSVERGPHSRDQLCALLWPELPESAARQNLSQALTQLRKALGDKAAAEPLLLTNLDSIQLNPVGDVEVDVAHFTALVAKSEKHPHRAWHLCTPCAQRLREAVALYRGDFLAQFFVSDSAPFEEWALLSRERLRQRMLSALERLAHFAEWRGGFAEAVAAAQRQVELEPLRDAAHRELMRLLALSGQHSAALAQYEQLRRMLAEALQVEPEAKTTALYAAIQSDDPAMVRRLQPPPSHLLAPPAPLIGREAEALAVRTHLQSEGARLLTLTGAPGIGKTRLALEVAHALRYDFEEGAAFVELAPLVDHALVPSAIAQAFGVKERGGQSLAEAVSVHLQAKHMLLVLDNFEQVLDAAAFVADLLAACPALIVLVTSRAPLRIRAEQQQPLAPLAEAEAVALFVERARAIQSAFALTPENASDIAAICRRVDGLPLAVELIAARIELHPPAGLLAQLDHQLASLVDGPRDLPARQRTLRSAIQWSVDLLPLEAQRVFAHLGVFAGGCTAEAAQAVLGESLRALPTLEALIEAGLVQARMVANETRFTLLETIREFALEQLIASAEAHVARKRHAEYFADVAELTRSYMAGAQQEVWFARLSADLDNLRNALRWTSEHSQHRTMLRMSAPLYHFWWQRGLANEGLRWLEMALPHRAEAPLGLQAEALINAGVLAYQQDDYARARIDLLDGLQAARQADHKRLIRGALANLGNLSLNQGEFDRVEAYLAEAIALSRAIDDEAYARFTLTVLADLHYRQGRFADSHECYTQALQINQKYNDQEGIADSLWGLARAARGLDDTQQAMQHCTEALAAYRQLEHAQGIGWVLNVRADIARDEGRLSAAVALYREALTIRLKHDDKQGCTRVLSEAAHALVRLRRWTQSVQIMGAADIARTTLGGRMTDYEQHVRDGALRLCRAALDVQAYKSAWESGQAMTLQQAVALVE